MTVYTGNWPYNMLADTEFEFNVTKVANNDFIIDSKWPNNGTPYMDPYKDSTLFA